MIRQAGVMCPGEKRDSMPDSMMDGLALGELGPITFICGARAISMGGERNRTSLQSIFQIQMPLLLPGTSHMTLISPLTKNRPKGLYGPKNRTQ